MQFNLPKDKVGQSCICDFRESLNRLEEARFPEFHQEKITALPGTQKMCNASAFSKYAPPHFLWSFALHGAVMRLEGMHGVPTRLLGLRDTCLR